MIEEMEIILYGKEARLLVGASSTAELSGEQLPRQAA
jgi:hypothetical protein